MQKRPSGATRIAVSVLWTTPIEFPVAVLFRIMAHPYMLAFLGLIFLIVVMANDQPAVRHVPFPYRAAVYLVAVVVITGIAVGWMLWRVRRADSDPVRVNLTAVLTIAHFGFLPFVDWIERIYFLQEPFSTLQLSLRILFYLTVVLLGLALLFSYLGKEISGDAMRSAGREGEGGPPGLGDATVGGTRVALDRLILMRAQTSRVEVVTLDGTVAVPGPLAERVAELPQGSGRLVHRHVWVRDGAVTGHRMDGRELSVLLAGGHVELAAASRHDELLPWLRALDEAKDQASNRSA